MLKISEMAKLANTTRRTLIYYDKEGIFSPVKKNTAGYRYYSYNQLYDLLFILSLKSLGMPLEEIKQVKANPDKMPLDKLLELQRNVQKRIVDLEELRSVINQNIENGNQKDVPLYEPTIQSLSSKKFWCSTQSVACTDEEVASLFTGFYKQLHSSAMVDTLKSGYFTYLDLKSSDKYADASFRVIKEVSSLSNSVMPVLEKRAGSYAMICVENSSQGVDNGLSKLKDFCRKQDLNTDKYLWQINVGKALSDKGASEKMWLEYLIKS